MRASSRPSQARFPGMDALMETVSSSPSRMKKTGVEHVEGGRAKTESAAKPGVENWFFSNRPKLETMPETQ